MLEEKNIFKQEVNDVVMCDDFMLFVLKSAKWRKEKKKMKKQQDEGKIWIWKVETKVTNNWWGSANASWKDVNEKIIFPSVN